MLQTNKAELRQITNAAIDAARRETSVKADSIFRSALDHLKVEVAANRNFAVVMSLKAGTDYTATGSIRRLEPQALVGVAARVFKLCEVFDPTLEFWSREMGDQRDSWTEQGFNIVLHWQDADDLVNRVSRLGDATLAVSLKSTIEQIDRAVTDKVRSILDQLKEKAMVQAKSGKDWAIVMSLREGADFTRPQGASSTAECKAEWLGPVAKAVWDACGDFKPELQFWSREEGDQRDSWTVEGYNIVIHW
jgi:hypothetical protein